MHEICIAEQMEFKVFHLCIRGVAKRFFKRSINRHLHRAIKKKKSTEIFIFQSIVAQRDKIRSRSTMHIVFCRTLHSSSSFFFREYSTLPNTRARYDYAIASVGEN